MNLSENLPLKKKLRCAYFQNVYISSHGYQVDAHPIFLSPVDAIILFMYTGISFPASLLKDVKHLRRQTQCSTAPRKLLTKAPTN